VKTGEAVLHLQSHLYIAKVFDRRTHHEQDALGKAQKVFYLGASIGQMSGIEDSPAFGHGVVEHQEFRYVGQLTGDHIPLPNPQTAQPRCYTIASIGQFRPTQGASLPQDRGSIGIFGNILLEKLGKGFI
jgi:hypothetical protein